MKMLKKSAVLLLAALFVLTLFSCSAVKPESVNTQAQTETLSSAEQEEKNPEAQTETERLWQSAQWLEDKTFGEGEKCVKVTVKAGEKSVLFTLYTDASTLGEALLENELVEGEEGQYGLYIKKVNSILADYDVDGSYWGFYQNGEYMMTGVDSTAISGGEAFELVRTK